MATAFITGTSSGFGRGIAMVLRDQGWRVLGCSRRGCDLEGVADQRCDLRQESDIDVALRALLADAAALDLVVLNAGVLGPIGDLTQAPLDACKEVMDINLWANKRVMDWLHRWQRPIAQVVMISSGASVLGNRGWSGYGLSKAALNMLAKLYAHEFAHSHISAVAPGIIDTAMMAQLCDEDAPASFSAAERLRSARGTEGMPGSVVAAERLISILPELRTRASGSFVDLREIVDPEGYAKLYGR
jgi:NAD(P)-dependent dehydrogenase (short-subunit alcohol dehydrogenase family)